ncbi:hypothetical protein ACHWQZ_G001212 [Mnemiopsis leidyi]
MKTSCSSSRVQALYDKGVQGIFFIWENHVQLDLGCQIALEGKRYNWRHDQVLRVICRALSEQLERGNKKKSSTQKTWSLQISRKEECL